MLVAIAGAAVGGRLEDATAAYNRRDYTTALRLLRPLAEQGDAAAQFVLGLVYYLGHGLPQNYTEAVKWLRKAADQGNANAHTMLGTMYRDGQGVPQDYAEAAKWYRKAADQGDAIAQSELGVMYARGQGVPQNYAEAAKWFHKAADQGDTTAKKNLAELSGRSSPAQSDEIPDDFKPIAAATRIFALQNNMKYYGVANADKSSLGNSNEISHAPGRQCTFNLKARDGHVVESIDFKRLSGEYQVSRDTPPFTLYHDITVAGRPGAVCYFEPITGGVPIFLRQLSGDELRRHGHDATGACSDKLVLLSLTPHDVELALRALRYIFSNVCEPAELPF
jgi:Sel1 repeat